MQYLSSRFTRRVNDRYDTDGPMMRGRFRSLEVDSDEYLVAAFRYIHLNPVPLLRGRPLLDYRWSSLRSYLGYRRPPDWLEAERFSAWLGGTRPIAQLIQGGVPFDIGVETLDALAGFALDETGVEGAGTSRTALLALAERFPDHAAEIRTSLRFATPKSFRQARARARLRVERDVALQQAVAAVERAIA
jgi:hypothetical protein